MKNLHKTKLHIIFLISCLTITAIPITTTFPLHETRSWQALTKLLSILFFSFKIESVSVWMTDFAISISDLSKIKLPVLWCFNRKVDYKYYLSNMGFIMMLLGNWDKNIGKNKNIIRLYGQYLQVSNCTRHLSFSNNLR